MSPTPAGWGDLLAYNRLPPAKCAGTIGAQNKHLWGSCSDSVMGLGQLFRAAVCCGPEVGVREPASAGALLVGGFGFFGVRPLFEEAVTSQPKANSQVRLCRGSTASGGQRVQIAGQGRWSSMLAAGWRSVWQLRWVLPGQGGDWRLETWMRRWARVDGSQAWALDWTAG